MWVADIFGHILPMADKLSPKIARKFLPMSRVEDKLQSSTAGRSSRNLNERTEVCLLKCSHNVTFLESIEALDFRLCPKHEKCKLQGHSYATLYSRINEGLDTKPVKTSARSSRWPLYEIVILNAAYGAGKTDNEIRELVVSLEATRTKLFESLKGAVL